jgi:hypothetical protein
MPKKKPSSSLWFWLAAAYHLSTLVADTEAYLANLRRFGAKPTGWNLVRVLIAEGVLLKDLGLPE